MSHSIALNTAGRFPLNTKATLVGLFLGLGLGVVGHFSGERWLVGAADVLGPIGSLWADALRTLAIPLVVCLLVTGLAGAGAKMVGRLGAASVGVFVAILVTGAVMTAATAPALFRALGLRAGALHGMRVETAATMPSDGARTPGEWLGSVGLEDVIRSMSGGGLLPIILASVVFAVALTQIPDEPRRRLLDLFGAALAVILVVLSWILIAAPVAVFALAYSMSVKGGASAAQALGWFVLVGILLLVIFWAALYPTAAVLGRIPMRRFAAAAAPAQAVAVSTRSSIASLPALLESGDRAGLAPEVNAFVMPLAVSVFKANRTISGMLKLIFLTMVYGIELGPGMMATYAGLLVLLSFATPGTPSGGVHSSTAPLLAMGIPMEGIALVYAVDVLPDVFKTLVNVTADLTAGTIVNRVYASGTRLSPARVSSD